MSRGRRLALAIVATLGTALVPSRAGAEERASARLSHYADDNATTVTSPRVAASAQAGRLGVQAIYDVDVVTSASVDLVTAASPRGFREVRHGVSVGASYRVAQPATVRGRLYTSVENDYRSLAGTAGLTRELRQGTLMLDVVAGAGADRVGRAGEPSFGRDRLTSRVDGTLSATLTRATVADVVLSGTLVDGFQSSPYRFVRLHAAPGDGTPVAVPEAVPDRRLRGAAAVRVRQAFGRSLFAHADYRFYADDWALQSHTASAQLLLSTLGDRLTLRALGRAYWQTAASFYRAEYVSLPSVPRYRTADKEAAAGRTILVGGHADWMWSGRRSGLRVGVDVDRALFEYDDFPAMRRRAAWIVATGVEVTR